MRRSRCDRCLADTTPRAVTTLVLISALLWGQAGCGSTAARAPAIGTTLSTATAAATAVPSLDPPEGRWVRSGFTLLQMNLCLSGMAGCYDATAYPAVVTEAAGQVRALSPDAVTVTEACRRDVVRMARRLGYHVRFAEVIYAGTELACVDPAGRGLFGDAVLTRASVVRFESRAFTTQADLEERRWLCATTRDGLDVCTAHLETPHTAAATAARDAQCAELRSVLAARPSGTFVFGGDLNRRESCAPLGAWSLTDRAAQQHPGIQHGYGSSDLRGPTAEVVATQHSDHDLLVIRATPSRGPSRGPSLGPSTGPRAGLSPGPGPGRPLGVGDARGDVRREPRGRGSARR